MNQNVNTSESANPAKVQINILLEGPQAERFFAYKSSRKIRANAEVARSLLLERLAQVEAEASAA